MRKEGCHVWHATQTIFPPFLQMQKKRFRAAKWLCSFPQLFSPVAQIYTMMTRHTPKGWHDDGGRRLRSQFTCSFDASPSSNDSSSAYHGVHPDNLIISQNSIQHTQFTLRQHSATGHTMYSFGLSSPGTACLAGGSLLLPGMTDKEKVQSQSIAGSNGTCP